MTKSVVDLYAQTISEQIRKERGEILSENAVAMKVAKHAGIPEEDADYAMSHVGTHGKHHTYVTGESHWSHEGEPANYITHDTSTGKSHDFELPAKKVTSSHVHSVMNKAVPGGVSAEHAKKVADEHNFAS